MNADSINTLYFGDPTNRGVQRCRERIHWICRQARGASVLDVGCSQGIVCLLLGREGFACTGIDIEKDALDMAARELAKESGPVRDRVAFRLADATAMPFPDGPFDTVILGEVLEHLAQPARVLGEARRVLRDGGRLVVTVPFGLMLHRDHKRAFYPISLARELETVFRVEEMELLDGYIAAVAAKESGAARPSVLDDRAWMERLIERTEQRVLDVEGEYQRVINQLRQKVQSASDTIAGLERVVAELRDEIAEKQEAARAGLVAVEADARRRLTDAAALRDRELADARTRLESAQLLHAKELRRMEREHGQWRKVVHALVEEQRIARDQLHREHRASLALRAEALKGPRGGAGLAGVLRRLVGAFAHPLRSPATPVEQPAAASDFIQRVRAMVSATIPIGSTVAVISRGDDRLVDLIGRTAWHFPRAKSGVYAGHHPADSAEAISHLDQLRAAGAEFLVIPAASFWWMDYYAEFRAHLTTACHCIGFQENTAAVFALRPAPAESDRTLTVHYNPKATGAAPMGPGETRLVAAARPAATPADFRPPAEDEREMDDVRLLYHLLGPKTPADPRRVLLYANVNINVIDGSSVWLINVAKLLSARYKVDLLLRAPIKARYLLSELEANPDIRIISPDAYPLHMKRFGDTTHLEDYSASELIAKLDMENDYRFVLCRGRFVNYYLSLNPRLSPKLVAYFLMDYYKFDHESLESETSLLRNVIYNARVVLVQTQMLKDFVCEVFQCRGDNMLLLPPLVAECVEEGREFANRRNLCLYAGKFDVEWRIDDIVNVCERSQCRLQLVGNKFHNQMVGAETLKEFVARKAASSPHIEFLGAVDHKDMAARIDEADFSISVRTDKYLAAREFSTKVLEFGARGKPTIVNNCPINRAVLGEDYPLFANTNDELAACLKRIQDPAIYARAAALCLRAAQRSLLHNVVGLCDQIEALMAPMAPGRRVLVISDDKDHCHGLDQGPAADVPGRMVRMFCPRTEGVRHDPLYRLLCWADAINVHMSGALDQGIAEWVNQSGKEAICTGRTDLGLVRVCATPGGLTAGDLEAHDHALTASVVVPCKDLEPRLLERALDSVLKQSGLDGITCEIIVVDDASQVPVASTLDRKYLECGRLRILRNERNKGLGPSRNIGFEVARGRNIFFLDGDDYYSEGFIIPIARRLQEADVVFSRMAVHRENENVLEDENYINEAIAELNKAERDPAKVLAAVHACVKGYRRDAIESGRLFFQAGYHEDVYPWFRFVLCNPDLKLGAEESAVYYRTIRNGSNQITQNTAILKQRLTDLNVARSLSLDALRSANGDGRYSGLIVQHERLIALDAARIS